MKNGSQVPRDMCALRCDRATTRSFQRFKMSYLQPFKVATFVNDWATCIQGNPYIYTYIYNLPCVGLRITIHVETIAPETIKEGNVFMNLHHSWRGWWSWSRDNGKLLSSFVPNRDHKDLGNPDRVHYRHRLWQYHYLQHYRLLYIQIYACIYTAYLYTGRPESAGQHHIASNSEFDTKDKTHSFMVPEKPAPAAIKRKSASKMSSVRSWYAHDDVWNSTNVKCIGVHIYLPQYDRRCP